VFAAAARRRGTGGVIERDLQEFISGSVPSVWALELLLFLRAHPGQSWTRERLVQELRGSQTVVQGALAVFETSGLVRCEAEGCEYQPASPALADLCDSLARLYRERPVSVINAITRSKTSPLESFANAFRLKDPPK
jgi:hypothetical protein